MPPLPADQSGALAKGAAARGRPLVHLRKRLGSWFTDLEYRLRTSRPFTHGTGGARVFYPGCSLPAADPALVLRAYDWLRARDPSVVLWSDCCGMPLEKFSSPEAAERGRERTRRLLRESKTTEIITACGNCTVQFDSLAVPGLKLTSLYGLLAEEDWGPRPTAAPTIVHHPCSARIDKDQQTHFRKLVGRLQLNVVNVDEKEHPLSCCLIKSPSAMAKREALAGARLITYCAHCTMAFQEGIPTRHVLQEAFGKPEDKWLPQGKIGRFRQYLKLARLAATPDGPTSTQSAPQQGRPTPVRSKSWWAGRVLLGLVAVAALAFTAHHFDLPRAALTVVSWSRNTGPLGALVYAAAYVLASVLLLPGALLTLGAGFAWGPVVGVAIVSPVSVLASSAAFALGRTLLRPRVERSIGGDPRLSAIDRAVGENGLKLVLLLRLSPLLPYNVLNYALALTRVRLRDYVLGSALGMFPATVLYVYLGSLATQGSELLAGQRPAAGPASLALYWGGLLATVLVVVLVTRIARAELKKMLVQSGP